MVGWATVVAVSLGTMMWRHLKLCRRVRRLEAFDTRALPVDFDELCRAAGLSQRVDVRAAPWMASPAVWGLVRPRLLVPPDLGESLGPEALRWVLLHELAHVRRRDLWVVLYQRLVQVAYFFHPAVWVANRIIDVQREYACDDAALAASAASRRACGDGLLTLVERANALAPPPPLAGLGLLHSPALIRRRLMRILDARRPVQGRLTVGAAAILALAAVVVLPRLHAAPGGPQEPAQAPEAAKAGPAHTIRLQVVNTDDHRPLAGATVRVKTYRLGHDVQWLTADAEGRCSIAVPEATPEWLMVAAWVEGFVPLEMTWKDRELLDSPPAEFTLSLQRGEMVGGLVQDEQKRPIAGAKVFVWVRTQRQAKAPSNASGSFPVVTDAEGRWRAPYLVPGTKPETEVLLRLEHPDFVSEVGGFSRRPTAQMLRGLEHVEVMKTGVAVAGRVLGPDGQPVSGARVTTDQATYADMDDHPYCVTTDAEGRFRFGHVPYDPESPAETLTVQADGLATMVQSLDLKPGGETAVEVKMKPARAIAGRVVDGSGHPVAGAVVSVDPVVIPAASGTGLSRTVRWRGETDAEGRFVWADGPADGRVGLEAYKAPFQRAIQRTTNAGAADVEIVLHPPFRARGTVVDDATGQPVAQFKLVPGLGPLPYDDRYFWYRSEARTGTGGTFDVTDLYSIDQPTDKALMVEAEGYLPAVFDGINAADESVEHAFRLKRGEAVTGLVRDPDGQPVAGAMVELTYSEDSADLGNLNEFVPPGAEFSTTTDGEGRYRFRPRERPLGVIVRHERGYGFIPPSAMGRSTDLKLQPWGRIEGVYREGDRAVAGARVNVWLDFTTSESTASMRTGYEARTDAEGRFVIDRVVSGFAAGYTPTVGPVSFEVRPGETAQVTMGGSGRTVVGRLVVPGGTVLPFPMDRGGMATMVFDQPDPPRPEGFAAMSPAQRAAYYPAWYRTPEGRAWKLRAQGNPIQVAPDGTFRAVDVKPGSYRLRITRTSRPIGSRIEGERTDVSASLDRVVMVSEGADGSTVDLGPMDLTVTTRHYQALNAGDRAPEIDGATTIDGKPLRLADFAGKFILLDFWATWCGPCLEEEPHLKAVWEAFGRDPRFVMIGLSLDDDVKAPAEHAKARDLGWIQGFLGSPIKDALLGRYGVPSIPQTILIGADGRVIARDLRGDQIRAAVAEALKAR
jgi:beta-lactamase regulating signal transducer with metallopeptidase domain/protocatechuate 3,4-dioxygenase beta subunit/thiol-disulfide isomerase/thioredoxin